MRLHPLDNSISYSLIFLTLLVQVRTHAIRRAHENIDKTLKSAAIILSQFDLSREVCLPQITFSFLFISIIV